MSNYSFSNNTFDGNNHFGDSYGSADEYIKNKEGITGDEKELVKLVFDHFSNNSDQQQLLKVIEDVKGGDPESVNKEDISLLKRLKDKLIDESIDKGVEILSSYLMHAPLIHNAIFNAPITP